MSLTGYPEAAAAVASLTETIIAHVDKTSEERRSLALEEAKAVL